MLCRFTLVLNLLYLGNFYFQEKTSRVGDTLNTMIEMVGETVLDIIKVFVNFVTNEYKVLEKIYSDEQKIADPTGLI